MKNLTLIIPTILASLFLFGAFTVSANANDFDALGIAKSEPTPPPEPTPAPLTPEQKTATKTAFQNRLSVKMSESYKVIVGEYKKLQEFIEKGENDGLTPIERFQSLTPAAQVQFVTNAWWLHDMIKANNPDADIAVPLVPRLK